jgi:hypothetical protein
VEAALAEPRYFPLAPKKSHRPTPPKTRPITKRLSSSRRVPFVYTALAWLCCGLADAACCCWRRPWRA